MDADKTTAQGTFSFTFAAEWDYVSKWNIEEYKRNSYSISIQKRLDMEKALCILLQDEKWEPYPAVTDISTQGLFPYKEDDSDKTKTPLYNEYLYFNSHMRRIMYNQTEYNSTNQKNSLYAKTIALGGDPMVILKRVPQEENLYLYRYCPIEQAQNNKFASYIKIYQLPISSIELRLSSIGVMLLSIRCQSEELTQNKYKYRCCCRYTSNKVSPVTEWQEVSSAEDLSWIANCGRRLFASRTVSSPCDDADFFNDFPLFSCIAAEAPALLDLNIGNNCISLCDLRKLILGATHLEHYTQPEQFTFIEKLISKQCKSKAGMKHDVPKQDYLVLDSYNDDRMYLHGTIESEDVANLTKRGWQNRKNDEKQAANDLAPWYGIMYSDPHWDATCQEPQLLISAVENATEARWVNYGTFYGMTYHSMVMLLPNVSTASYLVTNNDWIYLQMFLVGVLQRCAIQRFYREASGLLQYHSRKDDEYRAAVQDKYTLFLNQFWFTEVTEQEQGKSMFKKLQAAMNIQEDVNTLDTALEELYHQSESRTSGLINQLLVPMSVVGGFWAFTEMGLRLRDALSGWIPNSNPVPDYLGNPIALLLFVFILLGISIYFINQVKYILQRFVSPCRRQRKIKHIRKRHRK